MNLTHPAKPFDFANNERMPPYPETLLHQRFTVVEPFQRNLAATVTDDDFVQTAATAGGHGLSGDQDLTTENLGKIISQLSDTPNFATVFITQRKRIKKILNRFEVHFFKELGDTRAYPTQGIHWGGKETKTFLIRREPAHRDPGESVERKVAPLSTKPPGTFKAEKNRKVIIPRKVH